MNFHSVLKTAASTLAVGTAILAVPAFAQSTGAIEFDNTIVVTGQVEKGIDGIEVPDSPKAKQVLKQEMIARGTPGQSIDETINLIPGVVFTNADGYGSSGGNLMIRGFTDDRISQTFDGIPLNDTGNYALYTNQQLDPELIEQVNVNLGTTDVDSPTASASGSTVNYRSITPTHEFGARMVGTVGDYNKMRIFGVINTGDLNSSGTRAWVSASKDTYNVIFGHYGKVDKTQVNAKVYQPLGDNGDFIEVAGHFNFNRNNFTPDWYLEYGGIDAGNIPANKAERDSYTVERCQTSTGTNGVADVDSRYGCGQAWEYRFNPSRTGNIRVDSRFTLADNLVLNVDPYFQYTSANGGGTLLGVEGNYYNTGTSAFVTGYTAYFGGVDLNGDGDTLDTVLIAAPSQTVTNRIGVIASLRYDVSETQHVRVAYTYDRGRHRQTGETGLLNADGSESAYFFNTGKALTNADGYVMEKRDRLSYAILHQISGEYSGQFLDDKLNVVAGVRIPFYKRNLTQNCVTQTYGYVSCFNGDTAAQDAYTAYLDTVSTIDYVLPQQKTFSYSRALPTAGFTYNFTPEFSMNFNYSMGIQVPGTDNLYANAFIASGDVAPATKPETTNNFDLGVRYRSGIVQASLGAWYTIFKNRISSLYNEDLQATIYTNLGTVDRYGIDATFAVKPDSHVSAYLFGSYLWSNIRDNASSTDGYTTKGKMEGGIPHYTLGGRLQGEEGPVSMGLEVKRTGPRYYNSLNVAPIDDDGNALYSAKIPAYTVVNLDARLNLGFTGMGDKTYVQINVTNLFDKYYISSFDDAGVDPTSTNFGYLGAPRTFSASLNFQF